MQQRWSVWGLVCGAALWIDSAQAMAAEDGLRVVVTLKPVHSLVAGLMEGVAKPRLLIGGGSSEHGYAMKPSDARALREAQIVVRVSDHLETFLEKPMQSLAEGARVVTLDEIEGVTLLDPREGGVWEEHEHEHEHGEKEAKAGATGHDHDHKREEAKGAGEHGHDADHADSDVHIWLDPDNAKAIVTHLAQALSEADAANAARYRANAERIDQRLSALNAELTAATAPLRGKPYIVFHDAYQYFERRYGLAPAGSITFSPERQPGARRIAEVRAKVEELGATCVFAEPQFEPKLVNAIIDDTRAKSGVLDPLGAALQPGPDLYFELMRGLAVSLAACLLR